MLRQPSRAVLFVAGIWTFSTSSHSAPFGVPDSTFNPPRFTARCYPNYCFSDGRGGLLWSFASDLFPSGFVGADGARVGGLVRTTADGVVDTNFVVGPNLRETMGVAVQTDGRILVGGRLVGDVATSGAPNYRVFRLLTNGVLDATYHSPLFRSWPRFMTMQPDGKLLAATQDLSDTNTPNGDIFEFARLNSDGSLDTNFHRPTFIGDLTGIFVPPVVDTDGAIYLAGGFTKVDGQSRQQITRLHPDGTLDSGFVPSGFVSSIYLRGILLQPGGKVVIAGRVKLSSTYYPLIRLNSDGSVDPSFTLVPVDTINFFRARVLRATADGKILTVGSSMARFNSDGSLDNSFTRLPFFFAGQATSALWFEQLAGGEIVVPSDPSSYGPTSIDDQPFNGAVRLFANGTLDPAFSQPTFQQDVFPTSIARQSDGRLLVGGAFDHVDSNAAAGLARLNANGAPDPGYSLTVSNLDSVLNLTPLETNRAYVLVQTTDPSTAYTSNTLMRLQDDGTVDAGFNADPYSIHAGEYFFPDLLLQSTNPIVVGSRAQALLDQSNAPVVRLFSDGSRDTNFQTDCTLPGAAYDVFGDPITDWIGVRVDDIGRLIVSDLQLLTTSSTGKLLAAIGTNVSDGLSNYQLVRLNSDGALDTTFNGISVSPAGTVLSYPVVRDYLGYVGSVEALYPVRCLTGAVVQTNGDMLICGSFTSVGGSFRPGIARLKPDCALDPAFPAGSGPVTTGGLAPVKLSGISLDAAGKIWITGNFVQWDGVDAPGYVRLNGDGSLDTNCMPQIAHFALDDYNFSTFSGALPGGTTECYAFGPHLLPGDAWPRALSRLVRKPPPPLVPVGLFPGLGFRMTFNSETGGSYRLQTSTNLDAWDDWQSFDGTGLQLTFTDPAALLAPGKFYRVQYQQ